MMIRLQLRRFLLLLACPFFAACASEPPPATVAPRPVTVLTLRKTTPQLGDQVAGEVRSWKTEDLGMEVAGRVTYVIEAESDVEGVLRNAQGELLQEGTLLAQIDSSRYQLQVKSVEQQIVAAEANKKAILIEIDQVIPAQQRAASVDYRRARGELERRIPLLEQGTVTQEEFDRYRAEWEKSQAALSQLAAQKNAKQAEAASLDAQVGELQEALAQAKRDVADCRLVSPFRGQVAQVAVIPGAYVERGQSVVTVQMMDPISVEFEVSAELARRINHRDELPVFVSADKTASKSMFANVYQMDPVADPQTRTFTVTMLMRNERLRAKVPDSMRAGPVVRSREIWRLISEAIDGTSAWFIEEHAVHSDEQGAFVWKVTNRRIGTGGGQESPQLEVVKQRVTQGERRLPFLGLFMFQEILLAPGSNIDPQTDLFAGELEFPKGMDPATFNGKSILLDRQRWLLRPGDLVQLRLSGEELPAGFYVPVSSILEREGKPYVFVVDQGASGTVVRQTEVQLFERADTLRRIVPVSATLNEETQIVAEGALFLIDGESILPLAKVEKPQ